MESLLDFQTELYERICNAKSNFKKSPKDRITKQYLEGRLELVEQMWFEFLSGHKDLKRNGEKKLLIESEYVKNKIYDKTEECYSDYKAELKISLEKFNVASCSDNAQAYVKPPLNIKLPKINIPNFSGKYSEWAAFRDLYTALVHSYQELNKVQKLHYLKSYLEGEAEQYLRHIPIANENYDRCWKLLEDRYNNKKYICHLTLKRLFSQRNIVNESAASLKDLIDTTNDCLASLSNIGVDVCSWDVIIIHILCLKLDPETKRQWEFNVSSNSSADELPTYAKFKEFLTNRYRAMEFLDSGSNSIKRSSTHSNPLVNKIKSLHVTNYKCTFCSGAHTLAFCKDFGKESVDARRKFAETSNACYNCLGSNHSAKLCRTNLRCRICKKKHHSLLHPSSKATSETTEVRDQSRPLEVVASSSSESKESVNNLISKQQQSSVSCFSSGRVYNQALLATALVEVKSKTGHDTVRALLDQGSQSSFVTESTVQRLGLRKTSVLGQISGLGEHASTSKAMVILELQSRIDPNFKIKVEAYVLKSITAPLPTCKIDPSKWIELKGLVLADPEYHTPSRIDILLGVGIYNRILLEGLERDPEGALLAQGTSLGWILSGDIKVSAEPVRKISALHCRMDDNDLLRKFWELEADPEINREKMLTDGEKRCEEIFATTTVRDEEDRYVVQLPLKNDPPQVAGSMKISEKRFLSLENKLNKDKQLKEKYLEAMQEYINNNHMEPVPIEEQDNPNAVYLPHHAVVREDKDTTKLRIVFDASCKGKNDKSLNDNLLVGPTLQPELRHLVMRWRISPICLTADITKMYLQVKVSALHVDFQRILWRTEDTPEIKHYRMPRVMFGTAAAPYLAVKSLQQLARDEGDPYPMAAERVLKDYYMDDLLTGCQTKKEGLKIFREMNELLAKGGFELMKWTSNCEELVEAMGKERGVGKVQEGLKIKSDETIKIVGLTWNRSEDAFRYDVKLPKIEEPMSAIDPDCGVNAIVNYTLGESFGRPQFSVKADTGELCISAPLDHEANSDFEFPVIATDRGGLSTTAMVKIQLLDINDNVPAFTVKDYKVSLKEGRISAEPIVSVSATDSDSGRFGTVTYRIVGGNDNDIFRIDRSSGEILVTKPSLVQANSKFDLEISATDGGGLAAPQGAVVHVNVVPAGVGSALFDKPRYNFRVREDVRIGTVVGSLKATVGDRGKQPVRYSIVSGDVDHRFIVDPLTGAIRTSGQLDRETTSSYLLNVKATNGNAASYDQTQVQITLEDVNDNGPEFGTSSVRVSVAESASIGSVVYAARATDEDEGKNGMVTYHLVSVTGPPNTFAVNPQHGLVTLLRPLDYENLVRHTLVISAKDGGSPSLSANLTLSVDVQDVNDNPPVFEHDSYSANVLESEALNTKILEIQAVDKDTGNNARITYRIISDGNSTNEDYFKVQPTTGWVYLAKPLDRETAARHKMTITATDNGLPPLSASASLIVNVLDANDNDPVFSKAAYKFHVEENQKAGAVVGKIAATDADLGENAVVRYSLFPSNTSFNVNPVTGIITTKEILDREYKSSYSLFAEARDQGGLPRSSRVPVSIQVTDVNDNSPEIIDPREDVVSVREEQQPGAEVARVKAIDRDNGINASLTYSILNERDMDGFGVFVIDSNTGVIKTSTVLDHEERSIYRLTVAATDGGEPPRQTVRQLKVEVLDLNDNRPTFTSSSLSFKVKENAEIGHVVGTVACCDSDIQDNLVNEDEEKQISYLLMPLTTDHMPGTFEIDRRTGSLVVARQLDREMQDEYRLEVRALDTSATNNPQSSAVTVRIEIVDVNDNSPQWPQDPINIEISEITPIGTTVYNFTAKDADYGINGDLNFHIVSSLPSTKNVFNLDPLTGSLTLTSPLDYETLKEYWLVIEATDLAANVSERMATSATVHISVTDANDNVPTFVSANRITVLFSTLSGTIYQALAVDADSGDNGKISYYISGGNEHAYFSMEYDVGKVTLSKKYSSDIARVRPGQYKLNLTASDHGVPFPRQSHMLLLLNLQESTNVPPRFTDSFYRANISEDIRPGSFVTRLTAKSSRGNTGNLTYLIPPGVADDKFIIDARLGTITVKTKIDREDRDYYVFPVYVTDSSTFQSTTNFDVTTVSISVMDVNDNPPSFKTGSCYPLSVPENNDPEVIHTVAAMDKDIGANGVITYSITSGNNGNKFSIDSTSGKLTAKTLDRETQSKYHLTITAFDHGSPVALQGSCNITVMVEDQNDNDPVFDTGHYSAAIPEDAPIDTSVIKVRATDADLGFNKRIVYSLANESQGLFRIDNKTGIVFTTGYFDREKTNVYHFEAVATDEGRYIARSQRVSVEVTIKDVNDNKPIFTKYPFKEQIATLSPPGQSLLRVSATDNDIGTNAEILYELLDSSNHKFRINPTTGVLTATQSLASENGKLIHLKVVAKDKGNPPQSSVGLIEIRVGDFSDQTPTLNFQNATYNVTIEENMPYGKDVLQVTAVRSDGRRQRIIYEIGNGNDQYGFEIDSSSGVIRVNNSANLDYESYPGPKRQLVVVARTDGSPVLYGYCDVTINLLDQNDHAPRFTQQQYIANVLEGNTKGEFVVQLAAKDGDRGVNARILYHIVDGNHDNAFIIEPAFSGSVKTNIVLDREIRETYKLTVIATDEGDPQMTGTATLRINVVDVNDNQPTFPPPNLISVSEGAEVGTVLTSVTANDVDTYPPLKYAIMQGDNRFSIDRYSGKVVLNRPLDFEMQKVYEINITASDSEHIAKTTLTIKVTDVNDNAPIFDDISYNRILPEGSGTLEIGSVNAKDKDSGDNGKVTYSILRPAKGYFIDTVSGAIFVNYSALPPNQRDTQLAVVATDHGKPNKSAVASVRISTGASSEIKPFIGQDTYRITVNEDTKKGSTLLQIGGINDVLKKYNLDFHIISGNEGDTFDVNSEGALILINKLDRETQDSYVLGLAAVEEGKILSYNQNKTSITIFVTVADSNDNAPIYATNEFELTVSEDVKVGYTITQLSASDADLYGTPNAAITYNITSGDDERLFYIHPATGILTVNKTLDYDTGNIEYKLIIVACDQGEPSLCNAAYVKIGIIDENDNTPTFPVNEYFETIGENERVGTSIFTARATDLDRGRYGKLNYSIVSTSTNYNRNDDSWKMFQIDAASGLVNTNAVFDYEQKNKYEFSIKAADLGGKSSTVKVRIDIESRDEFYPQFTQKTYNFGIPKSGPLPAGFVIGQATATDRDKGIDGRIVYQLSTSHSYFKINRTTGVIILKKKVESVTNLFGSDKSISLVVTASSGRQGSLTNKTAVEILLDHEAVVLDSTNQINNTSAPSGGLSDWALGLLIAFIFIIIIFAAAFLFLHMKNKRHKKVNKPGLNSEGVGATNSYVDPSAFDTIPIRNTGAVNTGNQFAPPKYDEIPPYGPHTASSNSGAATTSELSGSDQSGSSGRGSAEDGEDGEDEEIRMINEGPLQRESIHRQANGVDDDNLSDVSVHNTQEYLARLGIVDTGTGGGASTSSRRCSENVVNKDTMLHHGPIDSMHMFDEDGAHENDITNLIYAKLNEVTGSERASSADEASAAVDRAMALGAFPSAPGDNTAVPTAGPSMTGSLSSIVHSEEELTGSYNWDYLLDWGPQYQPLAHVFSEIARLKDDAVSLQSGNSGASSAKSKGTSISGGKSVPPPLLTTVAPRSCPAPSLSCRQPQHLLPRSPISHDVAGGFSAAAAMSPSFSPSLSPLATRSPSMSPLVGPGLPPAPANRKPPHSTMRI